MQLGQGTGAAGDVARRLDHGDLPACCVQKICAGRAGESGPDDNIIDAVHVVALSGRGGCRSNGVLRPTVYKKFT